MELHRRGIMDILPLAAAFSTLNGGRKPATTGWGGGCKGWRCLWFDLSLPFASKSHHARMKICLRVIVYGFNIEIMLLCFSLPEPSLDYNYGK